MQIVQNQKIRNRWTQGFPRQAKDIKEIVLHATAGGGFIQWLENTDERADDWKKGIGLVQYHISRAGWVTEIISPDNWVYHSSSGVHDKETLGFEIEKLENKNASEITAEQADSVVNLIEMLCAMFPTIERVTSHDYNRKKFSGLAPKPCPGNFDWENFKCALKMKSTTADLEVII